MNSIDTSRQMNTGLRHAGGRLPSGRALVMGIVNVTPDSFSDGGQTADAATAIAHGRALLEDGADILDIGGESTRPGHHPVSADEELRRVIPVIAGLADLGMPISIDTSKAKVAEAAFAAGATILNDVWGLQRDPDIASVAARAGAGVIVMHNRDTVEENLDIVEDVISFLTRSLDIAVQAGIGLERICVDPGIGFGKSFEQNITLLRRLGELKVFGCPILVGASRKRMIGQILDEPDPMRRDCGSLGVHLEAVTRGADIIRAHNVLMHVQALRTFQAIRGTV